MIKQMNMLVVFFTDKNGNQVYLNFWIPKELTQLEDAVIMFQGNGSEIPVKGTIGGQDKPKNITPAELKRIHKQIDNMTSLRDLGL